MVTKPRILVTTAAGKTGRAAAHQLLEKGYPVNAFVDSAFNEGHLQSQAEHKLEVVRASKHPEIA